jgi:hypothetical protein
MNEVNYLDCEAKRLDDAAEKAHRDGNVTMARECLRQAFDRARQAADLIAGDLYHDPPRSKYHQSAALLALKCGDLREAERLIATALSGYPPDEIAEELRDLLEQVYFGGSKGRKPLTRASDAL